MPGVEKTRKHIVEQAAPLMNRKGMAGTSIADIMEVTKLAKGGIYGNFTNKEEICLEVFQYLTGRLRTAIDEVLQKQDTAQGKLFALLDFHVERLTMNEAGGCPLLNFGAEADDTDPAMKARVAEAIAFTQNRIIKLIRAGIAAGKFKSDIDAESFALKMFCMVEGAILVSRVNGSNHQIRLIADMLKKEIAGFVA